MSDETWLDDPKVRVVIDESASDLAALISATAAAKAQFDHREPPRHAHDWARLHARNVALLCGSCNNRKGDRAYAQWLDEQEDDRLTVAAHYGNRADEPVRGAEMQLSLLAAEVDEGAAQLSLVS